MDCMTEEWARLSDLEKYRVLLCRITLPRLMNHPLKEDLKACTNLHKKVGLLEQIYFGGK